MVSAPAPFQLPSFLAQELHVAATKPQREEPALIGSSPRTGTVLRAYSYRTLGWRSGSGKRYGKGQTVNNLGFSAIQSLSQLLDPATVK